MKSSFKYPILLILIFLIFIGNIVYWQSQNKAYFDYDSLRHYLITRYVFDEYKEGLAGFFSRVEQHLDRHPLGLYLFTSFFYFIIPPTQANTAIMSNFVFLLFLLFSVYQLGRLIKDEMTGFLACVMLLLYPIISNQAKIYMLDLPLTTMVALNIYLLIKTEYLRNKKYVVLFIVSYLAGMLVKPNFMCFTIGPLLYVTLISIKKSKVDIRFLSIAGLTFLYAVITTVFFTKNRLMGSSRHLLDFLKGSFVIVTWTPDNLRYAPFLINKIRGMLWYVWGFVNWQGSLIFFIFFIHGLCSYLKSDNRYKKIVIAWILSSYMILAWFLYAIDFDMEVTGARYSMPLLTGLAILTSYGLTSIKKNALRRTSIALVLIAGLLQNLFLSYPLLKKPLELKINFKQDKYHILPSYINIFSTRPLIISGSSWLSQPQDKSMLYKEIEDVFFYIDKFYKDKKIRVLLLSDNADWWHLKYLSHENRKDMEFICDYPRSIMTMLNKDQLSRFIEQMDFIIDIKNSFSEPYVSRLQRLLKKLFAANKDKFELIRESGHCRIFKNRR